MAPQLLAVVGSLGSIIGKGITAVLTYLATQKVLKLSLVAVAVTAVYRLTTSLANFLADQIVDAAAVLPSQTLDFFAAVMPGNLVTCVSIVVTCEGVKWLYLHNKQVVEWVLK